MNGPPRRLAALALLVLANSACGTTPSPSIPATTAGGRTGAGLAAGGPVVPGKGRAPGPSPAAANSGGSATGSPAGADGPSRPPAGGGSLSAGGPGGDTSLPGPAADPDNAGLGGLSRAFLRPSPFTSVAVQTDVAGDANPPAQAISRLTEVLSGETGKPVRLVAQHEVVGKGAGCWTDDDVARTTATSRSAHTAGSTVALYALFVDGTDCTDPSILGEAYGASSLVVFVDAAERAAPVTIDPARYVEAVTTHELGHVLGLVNIGYHSQIAHEDPAHPHHSSDPQSVMYWEIERGDLIQQLVDGPPQDFDQADQADLAGLRSGRY